MNLIDILNKEELRNFKLSLRRIYLNKTDNLIANLADSYKSGKYRDDNEIRDTIFPDLNKNSFYKLKNRLNEEVYKSLLILNYSKDDISRIINLFQLSRILTYKTEYKESFKLLKNALNKAKKVEAFDLQELICNEIIQLSNYNININVPQILEEKKEIEFKKKESIQINDFLAAYGWHLKKANFTNDNLTFLDELKQIENKIESSNFLRNSIALQIQLQETTRNILLQKKAFSQMSVYLEDKMSYFESKKAFNKNNYSKKIAMQIWLINAYIYQSNFEKVIENANQLEKDILKFNKMYYKNFYWSLLQSRLIAYYYNNKLNDAIKLLNEAKENNLVLNNLQFAITIKVNIAIIYFSIKNYNKGHSHLSFLLEKEKINIFDKASILKYEILDTIFYFEKNDFDFVVHRIKEIKKTYKNILTQVKFSKYNRLLKLISKMSKSFPNNYNNKLINEIEVFINENKNDSYTLNEVINYNHWLKAKIKNLDYYELALKHV